MVVINDHEPEMPAARLVMHGVLLCFGRRGPLLAASHMGRVAISSQPLDLLMRSGQWSSFWAAPAGRSGSFSTSLRIACHTEPSVRPALKGFATC